MGGSIPARAGEPCPSASHASPPPVYPRACGGTASRSRRYIRWGGLSPRVRGNPRVGVVQLGYAGSIPARAGEPTARALDWADRRVYPRACGGTSQALFPRCSSAGLSPRVRGNRPARFCSPAYEGSIPARAGEPRPTNGLPQWTRVYPRACGGTRVRGGAGNGVIGSIPARAGEPHDGSHAGRDVGVYPRACGGTSEPIPYRPKGTGLSPRVRGNRSSRSRARSP